jgi:hypothetical protein
MGIFDDEFSASVRSLLEKYHIPGMAVAVVDNGEVDMKVCTPAPVVLKGPDLFRRVSALLIFPTKKSHQTRSSTLEVPLKQCWQQQ